ncbi:MAG: phenylalanyl-tRNA synthetase, alpha subunit [Candidatus Methanoperedens nitroreducens]|uniref:Phenylalanyl-tRNA synthetase, alpha subunit n=1 Tax=Candidatus Methanoperedens nitratireducens TaxID=1392998 RepID=A0A0P7ZHM0_9EURY|nr:MAG: phenylalanyl-tRNA synthetase, alpha subunit [Candidatus Methanoperedens sp. BLZ1]
MTLTINLTNNEKRVLLALSKKDRFSPEDLAAASELSTEASMQSAFMLAEKGLCEIKETVTTTYKPYKRRGTVCTNFASGAPGHEIR